MAQHQLEAVDREMASLRLQINVARRRQLLLSANLLTSRALIPTLRGSKTMTQRTKPTSRQNAIIAVDKAVAAVAASTTRTTSGITAFRVKDPDPNAADNGNLLGIMLDIYSIKQRTFLAPYFLFFQHLFTGQLRMHQHTLPSFIPLRLLLRRYMNTTGDDNVIEVEKGKEQKLVGLVREIRRELTAWIRRRDSIDVLGDTAASFGAGEHRIKSLRSTDPSASEFELLLQDGHIIRVRLAKLGFIESSSVRLQGAEDSPARRIIERAVTNHKGSLYELAVALQQLGA